MYLKYEMDKWVTRYSGLKLAGGLIRVAVESLVILAIDLQLQLLKQPSSWPNQEPMSKRNGNLNMQTYKSNIQDHKDITNT